MKGVAEVFGVPVTGLLAWLLWRAYYLSQMPNVKLPDRRLRFRHMEIAPGGIVPLHDHADRPALIMVNAGQIYEYSSKCTVPILHKAGDIAREFNGTKHWWKNESKATVVLTIADIVNDRKPETMMDHM